VALEGRQALAPGCRNHPNPELQRVHWSKEASSFGFVVPWPKGGINGICPWRIDTMVETIIRRWCCHIGGNNFISRR
jgi:hypothetical protein